MLVKILFNVLLVFLVLLPTRGLLFDSLFMSVTFPAEHATVPPDILPASLGPFSKLEPVDNSLYVTVNNLLLKWNTSSGATSYEYCVDTINDNACNTTWISVGTAKTATLNNLQYYRAYYWQVRALSASEIVEADDGKWFSFITASPPPAPFSKLTPIRGAAEQPLSLTLAWEPSTGVETVYDYCLSPTGTTCTWKSAGAVTSVAVTGLAYDTTYSWQVRARNPSGTTLANAGVYWTFTTQMAPPAPFGKIAPDSGAVGQPLNPILAWETSAGDYVRYEYCYTDTTDAATCDQTWYQAYDATQAVLSGLKYDTTYLWQVRAINPSGTQYANNGALWRFTTQAPPPSPFTKLTPTDQSSGQPVNPVLTWSPSDNAVDYLFCVDDSNNNICDSAWVASADTFASPAGLVVQKTYYWQVKARNAQGETVANNAAWWSFTTRASVPAGFSKLYPLDTNSFVSVTPWLAWTGSPGADSYEYAILEVQPYPPEPQWVDAGTNLSVQVPISANLKPDTTYIWQVRALDGGSITEADTTWWSFTTLKEGPTSTDQLFTNALEDQTYIASLAAFSNYSKYFSLAGSPPPGTLSLAGNGQFSYTPPQDFAGTVSFDFIVWDGYNLPSPVYTATIQVGQVNDAPALAFIPNQTVNTGQPVSFTVIAQDADIPYNDQLTLSIAESLPAGATFNPLTGMFYWIPVFSPTHPGPYTFTVKVEDNSHAYCTQRVTVTVIPFRNLLPIIFRP